MQATKEEKGVSSQQPRTEFGKMFGKIDEKHNTIFILEAASPNFFLDAMTQYPLRKDDDLILISDKKTLEELIKEGNLRQDEKGRVKYGETRVIVAENQDMAAEMKDNLLEAYGRVNIVTISKEGKVTIASA